jgi:hypothetical protein
MSEKEFREAYEKAQEVRDFIGNIENYRCIHVEFASFREYKKSLRKIFKGNPFDKRYLHGGKVAHIEVFKDMIRSEDSHAGLRKARGQNFSGFGQFFLEFIEGKRYFFTEIEETVHVFTKEKGHETFPSSDWWEGSYTNEERFKGKKIVLKFSYLYESISSGGKR